MPYTPFYTLFPEIAKTETRSITIAGNDLLPADEYSFIELYCDEKDCDCRRVMFAIVSKHHRETLATIAYGWESEAFYRAWFSSNEDEDIDDLLPELIGPALNSISSQSHLAPSLLELVNFLLEDEAYVERIKAHYKMFRHVADPPEARKRAKRIKRLQNAKKKKRKKRR